jgi:hypothetical protein
MLGVFVPSSPPSRAARRKPMGEIANDLIEAELLGLDYETYMMDLAMEAEDKVQPRKKRRAVKSKCKGAPDDFCIAY